MIRTPIRSAESFTQLCNCAGWYIDRSYGKRNDNSFPHESCMEALDEFVLHRKACYIVLCCQPYFEIDAGLGKGRITNSRLELGEPAGYTPDHFACNFECGCLDLLQVAPIVNANVERKGEFVPRQAEIRDDATCQL